MSGRNYGYDKGSSRSTRDDSRDRPGRGLDRERERRRSRSRSPRSKRRDSPSGRGYSPEHRRDRDRGDDRRHRRHSSDEEVPAPPPPPRITKVSIGFTKPTAPIKMNITGTKVAPPVLPKPTVASVFNSDDDDDEPEEMPAEAKMRMRNIGRETPTSAGPNSFGKTKQGFCDSKKVFEKSLNAAMEPEQQRATLPKFPQTIYKIKPNSS